MLKRIRESIVRKAIFYLTLPLVIIFGIITLADSLYWGDVLIKEETASYHRLEDVIITLIQDSMQKGAQEEVQKQFDDYRTIKGVEAVHLLNHNGIIKRSTDRTLINKEFIDKEVLEALQGKEFSGVETDKSTNRKVFHHIRPIFNEESCQRCHGSQQRVIGVLAFISDWSPVEKVLSVSQNMHILFFVFSLALICALIFSFGFKMVISPLRQLVKATQKVAAGDLSYQIKAKSEDEIGGLEESFNKMVENLNVSQEEIQQQSEEIGSANEELRAVNEELIATNDQLLQATAELESRKAELQSLTADLERKVDEKTQDIRLLQERLLLITNGVEEGIMLLSKDFRVLWANKKIMDNCGLKESDVIGNFCYRITHRLNGPCQPTDDICPITDALKINKSVSVIHTHFDKDGNKFYAEVTVYPVKDENNEVKYFVHISRDVTDRVKMQEELRRYVSNLQKANADLKVAQVQLVQSAKMASIGQLASGLAHEINNPLTGVLNNVQLIKMQMEQKGSQAISIAEFMDILDVIEESALRCTKITRSLLDFAHAPSGGFQVLSVNEMVERVINLIGHELVLQNINIHAGLSPQLPPIKGNAQLLQQVIMSIITNARWAIKKKSAEGKGFITIKTEEDKQNNRANLYITDTGIGMSEQVRSRLFEPFFTTKDVGEGVGLGLSVAYGIIKEHQGTIEVQSQLNQGATFKISLPIFK